MNVLETIHLLRRDERHEHLLKPTLVSVPYAWESWRPFHVLPHVKRRTIGISSFVGEGDEKTRRFW